MQKKTELSKEWRFAELSTKSKLINAFDETCLMDIKEEPIGCNNVSIHNMLAHLHKSYGKVTDADMLSNKESISKQSIESASPAWNADTEWDRRHYTYRCHGIGDNDLIWCQQRRYIAKRKSFNCCNLIGEQSEISQIVS